MLKNFKSYYQKSSSGPKYQLMSPGVEKHKGPGILGYLNTSNDPEEACQGLPAVKKGRCQVDELIYPRSTYS